MVNSRRILVLGVAALLLLGTASAGRSILSGQVLQDQVKATGKPAPSQPALPHLVLGDVISTESAALSVWRNPSDVPIWTKKTDSSYYNQVAVGDVDSDGKSEIVVPVAKGTGSAFKIFIDVYKEGSGVPISSEKYSPGYFTDDSRVICDVTIANVIPETAGQKKINEIVVSHWYNLVIFQWDGTNFRIKQRIEARYINLPVTAFNGTTAKNIDADPEEEIFVSGQDTYSGPGYIYKIDMDNNANYTYTQIGSTLDCPITNIIIGHSLRAADLDGDGALEICLPAWYEDRSTSVSYWTAYLLVLEPDSVQPQWSSIIITEYEAPNLYSPGIGLDVGELDSTLPGEEIALYLNQQASSVNWLYIFKYPFPSNGAPFGERRLQDANTINDIKIGNILSGNKIVVCGNAPPPKGKTLRKYFEVFDVFMNSYWKVFGESGSMVDLAIVK